MPPTPLLRAARNALLLLVLAAAPGLFGQAPAPGGLAAAVQPFVDDGTMAGAVMLVANRAGVVAVETAGYADLAAKKPMAPDTVFWIASMGKAMAAAALMMVVDEGKASLDDPVETYLPEFHGIQVAAPKDSPDPAPRPADHPILIREILSHTSGLPWRAPLPSPIDNEPLAAAVAHEAKGPLLFQPGTSYLYSNAGINAAGRIVEVVEGMPFEQFLQRRLLDPLGMADTTFWPDAGQLARLAKSYKARKPEDGGGLDEVPIAQLGYPLDDRTKRFPVPAGGLFATASDVAKFCRLLLNDGVADGGKRLLSHEAVVRMTTKETGDAVPTPYGFGLNVGGGGSFSHGGAYQTYMAGDARQGLVLVFLVQQANRWPEGHNPQAAFVKAARERAGSAPAGGPGAATEGQTVR